MAEELKQKSLKRREGLHKFFRESQKTPEMFYGNFHCNKIPNDYVVTEDTKILFTSNDSWNVF